MESLKGEFYIGRAPSFASGHVEEAVLGKISILGKPGGGLVEEIDASGMDEMIIAIRAQLKRETNQ